MTIEEIRKLCNTQPFIMSQHAEMRRRQRGISVQEIKRAISNGVIIEDYPDAFPHPACLILSSMVEQKPLHVVCGICDGRLWIITVYYPNPEEWETDYKTRKGAKQ